MCGLDGGVLGVYKSTTNQVFALQASSTMSSISWKGTIWMVLNLRPSASCEVMRSHNNYSDIAVCGLLSPWMLSYQGLKYFISMVVDLYFSLRYLSTSPATKDFQGGIRGSAKRCLVGGRLAVSRAVASSERTSSLPSRALPEHIYLW